MSNIHNSTLANRIRTLTDEEEEKLFQLLPQSLRDFVLYESVVGNVDILDLYQHYTKWGEETTLRVIYMCRNSYSIDAYGETYPLTKRPK